MAVREAFNGAPGPVVPGDSARRARPRGRSRQGGHSAAGHVPRVDHSVGDPRDIEKLADILVNAERPGDPVRAAGLDRARAERGDRAAARRSTFPGYFNGASRGLLPPGDPHHFDRTRTQAFAKADVLVIVGTPFDFRMGYGKRISKELQAGADRHGLPHRRQEPRHRSWAGRRPRRDPRRGAAGRHRTHQERQAAGAPAMAQAADATRKPPPPRSSCRCSNRTACRFIRTAWRGN